MIQVVIFSHINISNIWLTIFIFFIASFRLLYLYFIFFSLTRCLQIFWCQIIFFLWYMGTHLSVSEKNHGYSYLIPIWHFLFLYFSLIISNYIICHNLYLHFFLLFFFISLGKNTRCPYIIIQYNTYTLK